MKNIITITLILFGLNASAQMTNLYNLTEKERNEYLLKTAKETVMKHAPEWYRDGKAPEIRSFTPTIGDDKGRLRYVVTYFNNPNERPEWSYSVAVGFYADTGEVRGLSFGNGDGYTFHSDPKRTRNSESTFYYPYPKK